MPRIARYFWVGLAVRLGIAPFLLQWFHADERQMLEFAHFHAHGRLHPFMEVYVQLRNQTLPWLFSLVIKVLDTLGLDSPRAYLTAIQMLIGIWSWLGLYALVKVVEDVEKERNNGETKISNALGWFFALFWAFPFLYSRGLLEAVSAPSAFMLLLAIRRCKPVLGGALGGVTSFLRYPSILFATGAVLTATLEAWNREKRLSLGLLRSLGIGCFIGMLALCAGGILDLSTYGVFLKSLPEYFAFNSPFGPVAQKFGSDSLYVYWRWFEFLLTPWVGALALALGTYSLIRVPSLLLFLLPYVAGHIISSHREPRFMLPVAPLLFTAIAWNTVQGGFSFIGRTWSSSPKALRTAVLMLIGIHVLVNFAAYPLLILGQMESGQGVLMRNYRKLAETPTRFITFLDPPIDVMIAPEVRWADANCKWHRPPLKEEALTRIIVLSRNNPAAGCRELSAERKYIRGEPIERILRVRVADLWECDSTALQRICPNGMTESPQEPLVRSDRTLR